MAKPEHRDCRRRADRCRLVVVGLMLACATAGGCVLSPFLRSSELKGSKTVEAKYHGLGGKSFAVVVAADRMIQADFPDLVGQLTTTISERLRQHADPSGWVPPESVLNFQYQNPRWVAMTT